MRSRDIHTCAHICASTLTCDSLGHFFRNWHVLASSLACMHNWSCAWTLECPCDVMRSATGGGNRPPLNLPIWGPTLVELGQVLSKFGQSLVRFGQTWLMWSMFFCGQPKFVQHLAQIGQVLSNSVQIWTNSALLAEFGPRSSCDPNLVELGNTNLAEFGPDFGRSRSGFGRFRSTRGPDGANVWSRRDCRSWRAFG